MAKLFLSIASIFGVLSVALGAFGAHALKNKLTQSGLLNTYETAVQYQFYHTLALLFIGILAEKMEISWLNYAGWAMIVGIIIFSGSLYIMCFTGMRWLGAITPIGGVSFILGWIFILMAVSKGL